MNRRERQDLDRHITGNWGEDSVPGDESVVFYTMPQGTPEWLAARNGIPTASNFHRIVTASGKASRASREYMAQLLAEWILGESCDTEFVSEWMERGILLEPDAVRFYELQRDCDTETVGFVTRDIGQDRLVGASPDRLVGADGYLEVKCPAPKRHVLNLLEQVPTAKATQVQGGLWVTGRDWADVMSFHPEMPEALTRVERDSGFIEVLREIVGEFCTELEERKAEFLKRGIAPVSHVREQVDG